MKLKLIAHAEANAITQAARVGAKLKGGSMIVTALHPCSDCAKLIIQAGIREVYAPVMSVDSNWSEEKQVAELLFKEAGVNVMEYIVR